VTTVYNLSEIKSVLRNEEMLKVIEEGFVLHSLKEVVCPPVGHLNFENPRGDVHIKYGYIGGDDFYVVKIASSFYENPSKNLPSSNGLMLVFGQKTGDLRAILLDEGYLTDIRTGIAGAVVAKYLAPKNVHCIGIVGTGVQAKLQLQFLQEVVSCKKVVVWGRSEERLREYRKSMSEHGFEITTTLKIQDITDTCNLIVTTTPSQAPLVFAKDILKGTHITAVGADSKEKQELDAEVFRLADIVVADSIEQCLDHGDSSHAVKAGSVQAKDLVEIGNMILEPKLHRQNEGQITVADLTGVAIQDIQIAKYVYNRLLTLRDGSAGR